MRAMVRQFSFPLNVYAWLIEQEGGRVEHLHYGLFERPDETAAVAQQRAADLLFAHLPAPCRVLDVGSGLGTTLQRLMANDYRPQGLTPDAAQVEAIRQRLGPDAPIACCRLEDFAEQQGQWQLLLFQESAQYLDGLDLLEAADRLLVDEGEIFIMDEFALRRDDAGRVMLHFLPHFLAWAERYGFALREQIDLTAQAAPTVDWLLAHTEAYIDDLKREFSLSDTALAQLMAANRQYQARYRDGRYGYFLLRLQRVARPSWRPVRINDPAKATQMRALFAEVFGRAMSEAHWQWKYGDGRGAGIGIWDAAGRMVAHYGGVARQACLPGQTCRAFCAADFMVAPSARRALQRKGPAFLAAATFLEHELGFGAPHLVGIGFPNRRAYDLPARLGLYRGVLTRIVEVSLTATATRPRLTEKVRPLDLASPAGQRLADECWQAMQLGLADWKLLQRDGAWLAQRYAGHPDHDYRCYVVARRFSARPLGLVVLRRTPDDRCELLDMVGYRTALPGLLRQARRLAAHLGTSELFFWASDEMLPLLGLPTEAHVADLDVLVPGNGWTAGPPHEALTGHWWLMGGDTDCH